MKCIKYKGTQRKFDDLNEMLINNKEFKKSSKSKGT